MLRLSLSPRRPRGGAFSEITLRFTSNLTSENLAVTVLDKPGGSAQYADVQVALTSCPDLSCNGDAWQQSDLQFIDDDTLGHVLALKCRPGSYRISGKCPSISRTRFATSPGKSESLCPYPTVGGTASDELPVYWRFVNAKVNLTTSPYSLASEDWLTIATQSAVSCRFVNGNGDVKYPFEVGYHPYQSTYSGGTIQAASLSFPSVLYTMTNIIEGVE